jgi:hypothetical protein
MISNHERQLCGNCGAGKASVLLRLVTKRNDRFLEQRINVKFCVKFGKNASDTCALHSEAYEGEAKKSQMFTVV